MVLLISLIIGGTAFGDVIEPISRPVGFDAVPVKEIAVDEALSTISVVNRFPNGCYEPWNTFKEIQGNEIVLYHIAIFPKEAACTRDVYFHESTYTTADLEPGVYTLRDGNDHSRLGTIQKLRKNGTIFWKY